MVNRDLKLLLRVALGVLMETELSFGSFLRRSEFARPIFSISFWRFTRRSLIRWKKVQDGRARAREGALKSYPRRKKLGQILKSSHLDKAVKVWIDGLEATKQVYNKTFETWSEEPDWKERRENANMIVA